MSQNTLKRIIQIGLAAVLFVPILISGKFLFPYIHLKNASFRVIVTVLLVLAIWYLWRQGQIYGKKNYVLYSFAGLFLIEVIAGVFGVNPYNSFWSNYERMDGIVLFFHLLVFLWLLIQFFQTREEWLWLLRSSLVVALILSIYGLLQRAGVSNAWILPNDAPRIASTIGNPAYFGGYLLFHVFFSGILLYLDRVKWRQVIYALGIIFFTYMMYTTGTRGPFLGFIFGLGVMGVMYFKHASKNLKVGIAIGLLLIPLSGLFLYSQRNSEWLKNYSTFHRIANINLKDLTTIDRINTYVTSWHAYTDRPLLGYGPENYRYGFNKYYNPELHEQWFDRAHSVIFDYLNLGGPLALLFYLALLGSAVYYLWQARRDDYFLSVLLIGLISAYFFQNLFVFDSLNTYLPLLVTLAMSAWLYKRQKNEVWTLPASVQSLMMPILGLAVVLVVFSNYFIVIKPARANLTAIEAFRYTQADPAKSLELFQQAIDMNTYGSREIMLQLNNFASQIARDQKQTAEFRKKVFDVNRRYALSHLEKDPADIQFRMLLANTYLNYAVIDGTYLQKTVDLLEPHIVDSPDRLELYFTLVQAYLGMNNLDKAGQYAKTAFAKTQNKPSVYLNLMNYYAAVRDQENFTRLADEYEVKFDLGFADWQQLSEFYYNVGLYDRAERILRDKIISQDPNNLQNYAGLVAVLRAQGRLDEAIALLNELKIAFPSAAQDIESYKKQLEGERDQ